MEVSYRTASEWRDRRVAPVRDRERNRERDELSRRLPPRRVRRRRGRSPVGDCGLDCRHEDHRSVWEAIGVVWVFGRILPELAIGEREYPWFALQSCSRLVYFIR